jgi:hypothetical protein
VTAVSGQLDAINEHPALRMTPEQYAAIAHAGSGLMRELVQRLNQAASRPRASGSSSPGSSARCGGTTSSSRG